MQRLDSPEQSVSNLDKDLPAVLMSPCSQYIVTYIAGFVAFRLKSILVCEQCVDGLVADTNYINSTHCKLIKLKSRGDLTMPSQSVVDVCMACEKLFRMHVTVHGKLTQVTSHELIQEILLKINENDWFDSLRQHQFDSEPTFNHVILLIKAIAQKYFQVRYNYAGIHYTNNHLGKNYKISRQKSTKLVLFSGL